MVGSGVTFTFTFHLQLVPSLGRSEAAPSPHVLLSTETKFSEQSTVPYLLVILLHHRAYQGGWRLQGRYVKSKLQKTASFIAVESLDVLLEHTLILPTTLILLKESHE